MKNEVRVLYVDVETTGLSSKRDSIIELGMCVLVFEGSIFRGFDTTLESFIDPEIKIPEFITEINHITDDMVKGAPTYLDQSLRTKVNNLCSECKFLAAHNLPFDLKFLLAYSKGFEKFTEDKQICTLRASRHVWPSLDNHKLVNLKSKLLTEEIEKLNKIHPLFDSIQAHRALSDVLVGSVLLKVILDGGACGTKSWRGFINKIQEPTPVNKMTFGKYKGYLLTDVAEKDPSYFRWLLKQDWFREMKDLTAQVKKLLNG